MERKPMYFNSISEVYYSFEELPTKGIQITLHITDNILGIKDIVITRPMITDRQNPKPTIQTYLDEVINKGIDTVKVIPDKQSSKWWRIEFSKDSVTSFIQCVID